MATKVRPRYPKPAWLKVRAPTGDRFTGLKRLMRTQSLHTVCEEARCPNIGECWNDGHATFMILGDTCTRACGFCAVTSGRPDAIDPLEPLRLAAAVERMELDYCVITSVNRDDAPDGGAGVFAGCIRAVRRVRPSCQVEVLIPDFMGNWDALATVMEARPVVLNHNTETVPRLYARVRPKARYERTLELIRRAADLAPDVATKSGVMVGLGETRRRAASDAGGPCGAPLRAAHRGAIPPADAQALAGRAFLSPRRVRGNRRGGPSARVRPRGVGASGAQLVPRRTASPGRLTEPRTRGMNNRARRGTLVPPEAPRCGRAAV